MDFVAYGYSMCRYSIKVFCESEIHGETSRFILVSFKRVEAPPAKLNVREHLGTWENGSIHLSK